MPLRSDGAELRRRRELMGLTIVEFAKRVGYGDHYVGEIERGRANGGAAFHREAAKVLGCEIADITCGFIPRGGVAAALAASRTRKSPVA